MRNLLLIFTVLSGILLTSCRDDFEFEPSTVQLRFSKDTVYLDTVFTNIGSSTYRLKVYNDSDKDIAIPTVQLGKGTNSNYRIMVDGMTGEDADNSGTGDGKIFRNVELLAKDSMFIFIEVTSDVADANPTDYLYTDKIEFRHANNVVQDVDLVTLIQDAIFIYPQRDSQNVYETISLGLDENNDPIEFVGSNLSENDPVNGDELHWTNQKPYVVYGYAMVPNGKNLTVDAGARVHFHANSGLIVSQNASIQVNGGNPPGNDPANLTNEVIFEGDRLEPLYSDVPGQWGAVMMLSELNTNTLNHLTIKNATVGLLVQKRLALGEDDTHQPKLNLSNVQIYNCANVGILGRDAQITGSNVVINYCGQASLAATLGGSYNFTHSTFNNNWNSSKQFAVVVGNYLEVDNTTYISDLTQANFTNCIIYSSNQNALKLDKFTPPSSSSPDATFSYQFTNCLVKLNNSTANPLYLPTNTTNFTNCYNATNSQTFNPKFKKVTENKLWPTEDISTSMPAANTLVTTDILNKSRIANTCIGAYQFIAN
ncbi:MAG: hypothetical protein RLZZ500_2138 [Bacteroidota bacterium]|jgi:hypothetical protein